MPRTVFVITFNHIRERGVLRHLKSTPNFFLARKEDLPKFNKSAKQSKLNRKMASQASTGAPMPVNTSQQAASSTSPTPVQKQANFDLAISLILSTWPALSIAVVNNWGGPDSADKRDWFAGAISDDFKERPDTDAEELEARLVEVMQDEFEVNVEDGSEVDIAVKIMKARQQCKEGDFREIQQMLKTWEERKGKAAGLPQGVQIVEHKGDGDSVDEEDDSDDYEDEDDGDINMEDAEAKVPALVGALQPKQEPEVDDDGFTKVTGRRKR